MFIIYLHILLPMFIGLIRPVISSLMNKRYIKEKERKREAKYYYPVYDYNHYYYYYYLISSYKKQEKKIIPQESSQKKISIEKQKYGFPYKMA